MARALTFDLGGTAFQAEPVKLDRKKVYGWTETVATDGAGEPCRKAWLDPDGSLVVPASGTANATLAADGTWLDADALTYVDEAGNEVEQGEVGELCVKGPGLMTCYYNDPVATAETLIDGWLHTGDMARQDDDGFYWLVDRKKDVIITGGENLYPVQIEDFLQGYAPVKDVAVIGLPDERLGEIAAAIIELKPDRTCTEEDINNFCLQLPRYKRPRKIIFASVPRNPTGKIEKPKLRQQYCGVRLVEAQNKG